MEDEHGRGEACTKCGKIVYIIIFNEYPLGDGWSHNGTEWSHTDCEDTLAMSGKFTLVEHLPGMIAARIKEYEKDLENLKCLPMANDILQSIETEKIEHGINILKYLIPASQEGKIAKSCQVEST